MSQPQIISEFIYFNDIKDASFNSVRLWRSDGIYEPFVYEIEEISTGMLYIGLKCAKNCLESDLGKNYFTSSKRFDWKSNINEFKILHIYKCASNHDAINLEEKMIDKSNAIFDDNYYNIVHPNIGFNTSGLKLPPVKEQTRYKISEFAKTRVGEKNPFYGKSHTEEHKNYISKINTKEKNPMYGTKATPETLAKMSKAQSGKIGYWAGKESHEFPFYGKKHTDETKKKISDSWDNIEERRVNMSKSARNKPKHICENCGGFFTKSMLTRWHGDNCKRKSS
jgi:hypothetical protein